MTEIILSEPTPESVKRAKIAQVQEQAKAIADTRLRMLAPHGNPNELSQADHDDVQRAALRFVVETERTGLFAMARAHAEHAGTSHMRMRLQVDDEGTIGPNLARHFGAALKAYRRSLEIWGGQ